MDMNSVQQSLFPRQVNPARGSDQQHREQGRSMQDQLQQAEARQRAVENARRRPEQEWWRPERRLDGRLVRVGPQRQPGDDFEQARSDLMRDKIARTYGAADSSRAPVAEVPSPGSRTTPPRGHENIDFIV